MTTYIYRGDRLTADNLHGATCTAVRRPDGKCIRGRNGNMLVQFEGGAVVAVLARQLRKVKKMNWNAYKLEARKTAIYPPATGQLYVPMKLVGEVEELDAAIETEHFDHVGAEIADVYWYLSAVEYEFQIQGFDENSLNLAVAVQKEMSTDDLIRQLYRQSARINQHSAKVHRGGGVLSNTRRDMIAAAYYQMHLHLRMLCRVYRLDPNELMQANINDLAERAAKGTIHGDGHGAERQEAK